MELNVEQNSLIPKWNFKDILMLFYILLLAIIINSICSIVFRPISNIITYLTMCICAIIMIYFPIYRIKKKYGIQKTALGLIKPNKEYYFISILVVTVQDFLELWAHKE